MAMGYSIGSFIGSGFQNNIADIAGSGGGYFPAACSVIVGGSDNCIDTGTSSGYDTPYGFIGGGDTNLICAGACHSSIIGGQANTVNAQCAAIIGGSGNTVNHPYAAVFGNAITSVAPGTIHCNNMWLDPATYNTYAGVAPFGTFPSGTVYVDTTGSTNTLRVQI